MRDWLIANNISFAEMARRLAAKLKNPRIRHETVRRHCLPRTHRDHRNPGPALRQAYYALTDGAVTSNDWDGLPASRPGGAAAVATAAALPKPGQKPGPKLRGSAGRPATVLRAAARKAARKTAEMRKRRLAQREARA